MKRKTWFNMLMILGLALALGSGAVVARRAQAQGPGPEWPALSGAEGASSTQAAVGTAFTYQGYLKDTSGPVNGTCDFQFGLWDAGSSGSQVGSTQTKTGVQVSDGYFTVPDLDFGNSAFQGNARYLQIAVRCPAGSGSYTTLIGRVALTAAPYAHSLRPGAVISGNSTGSTLSVVNNTSSTGVGVTGEAGSASGKSPITGAGVWGDSSGLPGVVGTSNSAAGVFGWSTSNAGVGGLSDSGNGVEGTSNSGYGVYGSSTSNKAIYSNGDAHVEGDLTWKAKTSYVSVSAAAFHPMYDGYDYDNPGNELWNKDGDSDAYVAPVQLPHGATVTKLTFYWWDGSAVDGRCTLYRNDLTGTEVVVAEAWTSGSDATSHSSQDTTMAYATIDNSQYAYYLYLDLPDMVVGVYGVVIEYTITEPY